MLIGQVTLTAKNPLQMVEKGIELPVHVVTKGVGPVYIALMTLVEDGLRTLIFPANT